jgi:CheY-like chemotaxis protein
LAEVIGTAMEASKPLIERNEHQLAVEASPEGLVVHGDGARLTQVVSNLLNNAARYTPKGGRIALILERDQDHAVIRVRDNGIGIEPSAIGRVFDMFAQVDANQKGQSGGGLGIGLNVVKRLVQMHNGEVAGHSEGLGKGSEFIVRLPLIAAVGKPMPVEQKDTRPVDSRRVLVVDDNEDIALSMSLILKKYGHVVEVAHDGQHAVDMAASFKPDVILMDIGMPRMNGYEACAAIRASEHGKRIHIIAVSGWGQEEDRRKSHAAGFDGHVVKPMEKATMERVIAQAKPHEPA